MCNGTLLGYKVHFEDPVKYVTQATKALPANAARLRNIIHVSNHLMSHILHFYHLVALDYVNPRVLVGGVPTPLNRPFLCPRYDDNYYITTQRILAVAPLLPPAAVATLSGLPGWGVDPGGAVNAYLVGQYLRALNIRRICHEMQAIFSGRAPQCSGWTPGGATATVDQASINAYQAKLNQVRTFIGEPTDFANGKAFTMMFDVVAAAHLFPEYFWIGNSWNHFLAYGVFEEAGTIPLSPVLQVVYGVPSYTNPDNRGLMRGWKLNATPGAPNPLNMLKLGESIANSRYKKLGVNYPDGQAFKHPWLGVTYPIPDNEYSWLKSPRYDIGTNNWTVFEVGPLARMVVNSFYFAGILNGFYPVTPLPGQPGPDIATGADPIGAALKPVYASIPGVAGGPNLSGVAYNGDSVLDRIAARALEARLMVDQAQHFLNQLQSTIDGTGYGTSGCTDPKVPSLTTIYRGYGMTEASRGALSHWITMQNGRIKAYQAIVPTTWNASPRDALGQPGPAEQSLMSNGGLWIANPNEPIEVPRVTHSYDFCIACAVHLITPKKDVVKVDIPALPG